MVFVWDDDDGEDDGGDDDGGDSAQLGWEAGDPPWERSTRDTDTYHVWPRPALYTLTSIFI